jgi:hypothetical protein
MTLNYALIADGGIVLAADSQATVRHEVLSGGQSRIVGTYVGKKSKIRSLRNGSAFCIAGSGGLADALLAKAELEPIDDTKPFETMVVEYSFLFQEEFLRVYRESEYQDHCAFLFCGYSGRNGKTVPQIVKLSSQNAFAYNPVATSEGYGFSGSEEHGGVLYLHHRLYSPGMPMETAKCLAYCILSEVAELDNTVGGPIEMAIVTESGVEPFSGSERYEKMRREIVATVRKLIFSGSRLK